MAYQALYRKYRPSNFDEVVGQQPIIQTLKNAIVQNRIAHAYYSAVLEELEKHQLRKYLRKC
ncbi:hypothetical protein EC1_13730 [Faecalitalea cylindroides T2-87]|uniref:Uncharacterized protein n=1 Tax=Faecalitalea cylindroides T2-87 TaxID=717960 RepID=D4JF08_9FIRM|nr:hypothetical protein EC1_13730 [Faecalitalea cylindroides T2-87]